MTDGASVPVKLSAFSKAGVLLWTKTYTAPVNIGITEHLSLPTARLSLTAAGSAPMTMAYFPNPSTGLFTVLISEEAKLPVDIAIYDMQGTKVYSHRLDKTRQVQVQLPNQKQGLYILNLKNEDSDVRERIEVK